MLHVFESLPSTNQYCLEYAKLHPGERLICLAHRQTQGRGRNGKTWLSDQPDNLYLSYLRPMKTTGPLSLVVGLVLAQSLDFLGVNGVELKWPNDVLIQGAKVAGILIEGPVIGIGLNLVLPSILPEQPVTALSEHGLKIDKMQFAETFIAQLEEAIMLFESSGFKPFMPDWTRFDCLAGHEVSWENGLSQGHSKALGVNEQGALVLEDGVLHGGTVRVKGA